MIPAQSRRPAMPNALRIPLGDEIGRLINDLHIEQIPGVIDKRSDDHETAIHELCSRDVILWGKVLDAFLRAYHANFPVSGFPMDGEALEEMLGIAFDERTQPLTRYIIKMTLRGEPVSLAQLAERRYSSRNPREAPNFRKLQVHLRNNVLWRMRDLGLWSVDELKDGARIKGYAITAGPVLWLFHKKIYLPWRKRQLEQLAKIIEMEV